MARLITKKSTVAAKVPLATDLEIGELAVNTADAKIYTKHSDGNVVGMKAEPLAHTHTIADTPGLQAVLDGKEAVAPLKPLLVYYGHPIAYKGLWNAAAIIAEIAANFSVWVVGDTYGDPTHEEYATTTAIVSGVRSAGVRVYGYVPIGQNTSGLALAQMQTRVDQWTAIGVDGIFLDEFGFDYGNTRTRQKSIVDYVHGKDLPVCANAWMAEDFMCDHVSELPWPSNDWRYVNFTTGNPTNIALTRNTDDAYLIENFCFDHTGPGNVFDVQERCKLTAVLAAAKNVVPWALAVFPESTPGTLNQALVGHLGTLENAGAYIAANAYVYDIGVVGSGGFSFGSNGTPIWAPLPSMPATAMPPTAAAATDYVACTAVRNFGQVGVLVKNTPTEQSVSVTNISAAVLSGNYPGQGQTVIVSPTPPANPNIGDLWVDTST